MRFTVTPIGATGRSPGDVVAAVIEYLRARNKSGTGLLAAPAGDEAARYYADSGDSPGVWLGQGAAALGPAGMVDNRDLTEVLSGRHPATAERLLSARGSAGRRHLAVGTVACVGQDGQALYAVNDAAAALQLEPADVEALVVAGEQLAAAHLVGAAVSTSRATYLVPLVTDEGTRFIAQSEIDAVRTARDRGVTAAAVRTSGDAGDELSLVEAARLAGLSARYLRGRCAHYAINQETIEAGERVKGQWLRATRTDSGAWRVSRGDLAGFLERRVAPAVRIGYDLTLTTEKSLSVLALLSEPQVRSKVLAAIAAGNKTGLDHFEQQAKVRRRGRQVDSAGLTIASFLHFTSRALDPFVHHHNVVINTAENDDSSRHTLDGRTL